MLRPVIDHASLRPVIDHAPLRPVIDHASLRPADTAAAERAPAASSATPTGRPVRRAGRFRRNHAAAATGPIAAAHGIDTSGPDTIQTES